MFATAENQVLQCWRSLQARKHDLVIQAILTLTMPSHWMPGHLCLTLAKSGGFMSISL